MTQTAKPAQASWKRVGRSSGAQILAGITSGLLTVFIVRVLTAQLGIYNFGYYTLLLSYGTAASTIVDLGLNGIAYRDIALAPDRAGNIIGINFGLRVALSMLAMPMLIGTVYLLYPSSRASLLLPTVAVAVDVLFTVIQSTVGSYFTLRVRSEIVAIITVAARSLFLLSLIILTAIAQLTLTEVFTSYLATDVLGATTTVFLVSRAIELKVPFAPRQWGQTWLRAAPLGIAQLFNTLYAYIDSIMLSLLSGTEAVALYALGLTTISVVASFSQMISSAFAPGIALTKPQDIKNVIKSQLYVITCLALAVAIGGYTLALPAVRLLGKDNYDAAETPFSILALSLVFTYPATYLISACAALGKLGSLPWRAGGALTLNVCLNFILIPTKGAMGASVAFLVSEAVNLTLMLFVWRRTVGFIPLTLDMWKPGIAALGMFTVAKLGQDQLGFSLASTLIVAIGESVAFLSIITILRGLPQKIPSVSSS